MAAALQINRSGVNSATPDACPSSSDRLNCCKCVTTHILPYKKMYPDSTPYRYISVYAVALSSPDFDSSPSMNSHLFVVQFGLELNVARAPHPRLCIPPPNDRIPCTVSIGLATPRLYGQVPYGAPCVPPSVSVRGFLLLVPSGCSRTGPVLFAPPV